MQTAHRVTPDGWRYDRDGTVMNRVSPIRARLERAALLSILRRTPWTHSFDQSFQDSITPKGLASCVHLYGSILVRLPSEFRPLKAWVVAEPHPSAPKRFHCHGLWHVEGGRLHDGWWREAKEWMGAWYGWARFHPLAPGVQNLVGALAYPTSHAVKKSPTRFWERMALMEVTCIREGFRTVRYPWRDSWWSGDWHDGVLSPPVKEV